MSNTFPPLISDSSFDLQLMKQLVGDDSRILASCRIKDDPADSFLHPELGLDGYAFDGVYRVQGVAYPSVGLASWYSEYPTEYRSANTLSFPSEGLVLATDIGLVIYDERSDGLGSRDSLYIWMAFVKDNLNAMLTSLMVPEALTCGYIAFSSVNKTLVRSEGSWNLDGVQIGATLNLSSFPSNNGNLTVTQIINETTIQVQETIVDGLGQEGVISYITIPIFSPSGLQYKNGIISLAYNSSLVLSLDFIQDTVYADTPMVVPTLTPSLAIAPLSLDYSPSLYTVGVDMGSILPLISGGQPTLFTVAPSLPSGISLDSVTGIISGIPDTVISQDFTITASNAEGSIQAILRLVINDIPPTTLSYPHNPVSYLLNTPIPPNIPINSGGSVVSYALAQSLPMGLTLDPLSGTISGTPTTLTTQENYFIVGTNSGGSVYASLSLTIE